MRMGRAKGKEINTMEHYNYRGIYMVNGIFE